MIVYILIILKMKESFESPKMRNVAQQCLTACCQQIGEYVNSFTKHLTRAVKAAATIGLHPDTVKEKC